MTEATSAVPSRHQAAIHYRGLMVEFFVGGYFCRLPVNKIAIDADGAPDAYGPATDKDPQGEGSDYLSSAGYPDDSRDPIRDDWRNVLVEYPKGSGKPFERNGYYISQTSLRDDSITDNRTPGKFVDANEVCYIVMPTFWIEHLGVALGDLCLLWHARLKRRVVAIVADTCPSPEPLGEISVAAAKRLGGKHVSPRKGVDFPANGTIHCYIFKNSKPDLVWPLTDALVQSSLAKFEDYLRRIGRQID